MGSAKLDERFFAVVCSVLNMPMEAVNWETSRKTLQRWDSLKHLYLILALEEQFGVQFSDEEIAVLDTLLALNNAIVAKTGRERTS